MELQLTNWHLLGCEPTVVEPGGDGVKLPGNGVGGESTDCVAATSVAKPRKADTQCQPN